MSSPSIRWESGDEIEGEVTARRRSDPLLGRFDGLDGADRVVALTRRLAQAVDSWWQRGEFPPLGLVRDGLLLLEAGHSIDEAGRTLLLRGALYYGKGMRTALHHLHDSERAASVMRDMLLHPVHPLPPAQIVALAWQDDENGLWLTALKELLWEELSQLLEPRRTLARATYEYLHEAQNGNGSPPAWVPLGGQTTAKTPGKAQPVKSRRRAKVPSKLWRGLAYFFGLLALALLVLALAFFWLDYQQAFDPAGEMLSIPAGEYRISDPALPDTDRRVILGSFSIDRTEVTNRAYRLCFEADGCTWPSRTTSITRPDYFLNPALDSFPMVNVTHAQAALFCSWAGKRLPLEEEWEVAASSALTLLRAYRYPWGDDFDNARVNGGLVGIGDTLPTGTFSPGGDSPSGAADMAGNAAEWTATAGVSAEVAEGGYVVKGGSFQDIPVNLAVNRRQIVDGESAHPWLGFRCAVTNPVDE